eukprot:TRINITY_DN499_c0_g1_i2.p1 TRINITY_DN499_c0_g1~~TRINITY_DN499_c0_g1_i2.p1  ORF type:complete len:267 (-),score=91.77 TRINITY_DN499_c0_g1_i2:123-923(-)
MGNKRKRLSKRGMAIGKNKKLSKRGKGGKRRTADPFLKKEWYELIAPAPFEKRFVGKTCINKSSGQTIASEAIKGRVLETSLADLGKNEQMVWRKFKLAIEDVQGRNCLTVFHGMDLSRDKICQFIRKWQTLIETQIDVKTADGYILRLFCIGFTTRNQKNQVRKTSYAHRSQIKAIRRKMNEIIQREVAPSTVTDLIRKFNTEAIGEAIEKETRLIYPLQNVVIRKVKVIKKAKIDVSKLDLPAAGITKEGEVAEDAAAKNLLAQ